MLNSVCLYFLKMCADVHEERQPCPVWAMISPLVASIVVPAAFSIIEKIIKNIECLMGFQSLRTYVLSNGDMSLHGTPALSSPPFPGGSVDQQFWLEQFYLN